MTDVVSTLNHLAEISRDGAKGFADAAAAVQNPSLKTTLESASKRCETGARELDGEISKLGGRTDASGTTAGAMHRAWTNLKAAITGRDDKAILVECERGEDVAKAAYEEALRSNLPMDIQTMVQRQYKGVVQNHDLVKRLRDAA
ncbi:MAG: PA2169 family four-helix-bundle protein [Methylocystis sp.]|uniref:PA2169 family four-helix-bundle protein n=1 Tax=Methylocystis sp. TaxID=1911079 RepID=UPI003DA25C40